MSLKKTNKMELKNKVECKAVGDGKIYYSNWDKFLIGLSNQILYTVIFVCAVLMMFNIFISKAQVVGTSMLPTYNNQYTINNKYKDTAYYTSIFSLNRGDIVIPDISTEREERFAIKRLIAIGGDVVEFKNNVLFVNNQEVKEDYIANKNLNAYIVNDIKNNVDDNWINGKDLNDIGFSDYQQTDTGVKFKVNKGYVFYLGDNRKPGGSYDCADYGPRKESKIVAKILFVVPYGENVVSYLWKQFLHLF